MVAVCVLAIECAVWVQAPAQLARFYVNTADYLFSARNAYPDWGIERIECVKMNNADDMIGYLHGQNLPGPHSYGGRHAFLFLDGQWYNLQVGMPGPVRVTDINLHGDVVGFYENYNRIPVINGFCGGARYWSLCYWRRFSYAVASDLQSPSCPDCTYNCQGMARINDLGDVVATMFHSPTGILHTAYSWLGVDRRESQAAIRDLNNSSDVLCRNDQGITHWSTVYLFGSVFTTTPQQQDNSYGVAISDSDKILWANGDLTDGWGLNGVRGPLPSPQFGPWVVNSSAVVFSRSGDRPGYFLWASTSGDVLYSSAMTRATLGGTVESDFSDPVDFNDRGQLLSPSYGICTPSPPLFAVQPTNVLAFEGSNAVFQANALGALFVQWRKGGVAIPNATNQTLTLSNVTDEDEGFYTLMATNVSGSVFSSPAWLEVIKPPWLDARGLFHQPQLPLQFLMHPPVGIRVTLEASTNLQHWEILTNTVSTTTNLTFVDHQSVEFPVRFYRVQYALP